MRCLLPLLTLAASLAAQAPVPTADPFHPVRFLVGEWTGEGDGKPGAAKGAASFRFELDGKVLVRRSHAEYPAANGRPATRHQDQMTIFAEGGLLKAFYVDNEGHVIRYLVAPVAEGVAFTSEPAPGPRFRLTYLKKSEALTALRFELAPPGKPEAFAPYLEATTRKVK